MSLKRTVSAIRQPAKRRRKTSSEFDGRGARGQKLADRRSRSSLICGLLPDAPRARQPNETAKTKTKTTHPLRCLSPAACSCYNIAPPVRLTVVVAAARPCCKRILMTMRQRNIRRPSRESAPRSHSAGAGAALRNAMPFELVQFLAGDLACWSESRERTPTQTAGPPELSSRLTQARHRGPPAICEWAATVARTRDAQRQRDGTRLDINPQRPSLKFERRKSCLPTPEQIDIVTARVMH